MSFGSLKLSILRNAQLSTYPLQYANGTPWLIMKSSSR